MADINTNNFEDFTRNATIMFLKKKDSVQQVMRNSGLVREMEIPNETGDTREFTEVELEEYASRKKESEQHDRANVQQGYSKIGKLYRVSKTINVSYEHRRYGKYEEIKNRITNLGKLVPNRLDLDLTHRLTFGTQPSYIDLDGEIIDIATGDGLPLFSTAHLLRGSSSTFRNRLAGNPQLSTGSLEAMENMRTDNTLNQFGEKLAVMDDILWIADDANQKNTAKRILRSTAAPDQNNSEVINEYQGSYNLVILPRLATDPSGNPDSTKKKYWGVASSEITSLFLGMNEEPTLKSPTPGSNADDFLTEDWFYSTSGGWMIVNPAANWIGFSSGDGTP